MKKVAFPLPEAGERRIGTVFLLVYLILFPLFFHDLFLLAEFLFGTHLSPSAENAVYYYLLFAATVLIFHRFLLNTSRFALARPGLVLKTVAIGLIAYYGGNELVYRLLQQFPQGSVNLNDVSIAAQIAVAPRITALIVVLLAPFVEEILFRGLVFGSLRAKSRLWAYLISAVLFAVAHVWLFAVSDRTPGAVLLTLQYLVPGLIFAWAYDHSGTLWSAVILHSAVNLLSLWMIRK